MEIYDNPDTLSKEVKEKVNSIINKIKEIDYSGKMSIYYGNNFMEPDGKEILCKLCIVCLKGVISVYENDQEKKEYKKYLLNLMVDSELDDIFSKNPSVISSIHIDFPEKIIDLLDKNEDYFTERNYKEINAIIQHISRFNDIDDRKIRNENTLGALIKHRDNEMNTLDEKQFKTIYADEVINTHIRIRGLAGSGKTILLVKKMAYMHYKKRDLELVYVFYTKSLKQYISDLFLKFYKDFERYKEPNMTKIHILHSWGGKEMEGFYSKVCKENQIKRETYNDANGAGIKRFDTICINALNQLGNTGKKLYDYIFIDEAQDFSLGFFQLVLSTLKPYGKIIYAYDELQSINNNSDSMPSKDKIFGEEVCRDINLSTCYRTPKDIIVAAHALGLGIYRKNKQGDVDIINMIQNCSIWTAIGYKLLSGELAYGKNVVLGRDEQIANCPKNCIEIYDVKNEQEQYITVCNEICRLIKNEDIIPEDILVIDLENKSFQDNFNVFKKIFNQKIIDNPGIISKVHLVNKDNNSAIKFKIKGSIPYTTIFRAKGNEANIVFILNVDKISFMESFYRNRLFTAMTRAKFKVYILGTANSEMTTLINEFKEIQQKNFTLDFKYPTENELRKMRTIAKKEAQNINIYEKSSKILKNNEKITIQILKEQVGASSMEELIEKLQKYKGNE